PAGALNCQANRYSNPTAIRLRMATDSLGRSIAGAGMKVLVCGGAGYIGSHMVRYLVARGHDVVVVDNLSTGHRGALGAAALVVGDLLDPASLKALFAAHRFDAVMHFCALSLVGVSVGEPYLYYQNNVAGTLNLLQAMRVSGVGKLVFSSTAAVFGNPEA